MGENETPTHSGRCIFYTLGIKMEPTRPTDSLVNHFYTTRVENASPTHVGGSFLKSSVCWSYGSEPSLTLRCPRLSLRQATCKINRGADCGVCPPLVAILGP